MICWTQPRPSAKISPTDRSYLGPHGGDRGHTLQEHHDDQDWVSDAERWICQIQDVRQSKIDLDGDGAIASIHVVSTPGREPRKIVRDVEGLLKARLGLEFSYKKISVVQVLDQEADAPGVESAAAPAAPEPSRPTAVPPQPPSARGTPVIHPIASPAVLVEESPQARVECAGVALESRGPALSAAVTLMRGDLTIRCEEEGPNHPGMEAQLLGRATLKALQDLLDEPVTLSLAELRESDVAGDRLTVAAVDLVEGRRTERFFGCCSQRHSAREANVYAVLDALNRRLSLFNFKEASTTTNF